jgi:hypothetical protein
LLLERFGNSGCSASESYHMAPSVSEDPADWSVAAIYNDFGLGSERHSDFAVSVKWSDLEALLRSFAEAGHPGALRIQKAMKLAVAAERFIKKWASPQSK